MNEISFRWSPVIWNTYRVERYKDNVLFWKPCALGSYWFPGFFWMLLLQLLQLLFFIYLSAIHFPFRSSFLSFNQMAYFLIIIQPTPPLPPPLSSLFCLSFSVFFLFVDSHIKCFFFHFSLLFFSLHLFVSCLVSSNCDHFCHLRSIGARC